MPMGVSTSHEPSAEKAAASLRGQPPDQLWRRMSYEYGGGLVGAVVSFIVLLLLSRRLSVEEFGLYQVILNAMVFGAILLNFGLPSSMSRFVPEYVATGDLGALRKLLRTGLLLILAGGVLGGIFSFVCRAEFAGLMRQARFAPFAAIGWLWATVRAIIGLLEAALDALRGQVIKNRLSMLFSLAEVAVVVGLLQRPNLLPAVIVGFVAIDVLLMGGYAVLLRRRLLSLGESPEPVRQPRRVLGRSFWFGTKEYASVVLAFLWDIRVDLFLMSALLGATAAGVFGFAMAIMNSLWAWSPGTLLRLISRPLFVEAHLGGRGDHSLLALFQWYLIVSLLFAVPIFVSAIVLYRPLVQLLFRPEYLDASLVVGLLGIGMLGKAVLDSMRNVLVATEQVGRWTLLNLLACAKVLLAYGLIRAWGMLGAGIALIATVCAMTGYLSWWASRQLGLRFPWGALRRIGANGLVLVAVLSLGTYLIRSLGGLITVVGAGLGAYAVLTIFNPPFRIRSGSLWQRGRELVGVLRDAGSVRTSVGECA